jgi:hypothetical protein
MGWNDNQIKYAYEASSGNVSALPASPLLLPALALLGVVAPVIKAKYDYEDTHAPYRPIDAELHESFRTEYLNLMAKKIALEKCKPPRDLMPSELTRLIELRNPPWKKEFETWTYHPKPTESWSYNVTSNDMYKHPLKLTNRYNL